MKIVSRTFTAFILATSNISAVTHYVSLDSTNATTPYTSWATAATNIQQAVAVAATGDEVIVTNGVYSGGVRVTNKLTLRSVNGPQFTVMNGGGTNQCISLFEDASLSGFTLTNGYSVRGGGVECITTNAFLTNCIVVGNFALYGGGAAKCTLCNCTLSGNSAQQGGGAAGCKLYNCTVTGNYSTERGGGASGCWLYKCKLTGNSVVSDDYPSGGGGAASSFLFNCTLTGNSASGQFSAGGGALDSTLSSCTVTGNSVDYAGGGSYNCRLYNCTVTGNLAAYGGGSAGDVVLNSIVYSNTAPYGANHDTSFLILDFYYCCTTPMPAGGVGNITNAPLFIDYGGGNLRLQSNSPCIDTGSNAYSDGNVDLDGRPRIVGATVDMGAYEFQPGVDGAFIGWLQQYGLPTDGSGDYVDSDGDVMNNLREWVCGTDPTSRTSVLKLLSLASGESGTVVPWLSVTNRNYFLQRASNLTSFVTVAKSLAGQAGITTFTDSAATGDGPFFYRVGVKYP